MDNPGASFSSAAPCLALVDTPIAPTNVMSVLIVDDVAMNRDVAGSILRAAGYEVVGVSGGAEAVAAIKVAAFDVVLLDVRMPDMDGLEATRRIRALDGRRGLTPIVALTAQDNPDEIEQCRQAGMNGHVSKPFDPDELVAAVVRARLAGPIQGTAREPEFMTVSAPVATSQATGLEVPLIDLETFRRTASFLAPKALASCLQKITALAKALQVMLDGPEIPEYDPDEFAGAAHVVAGTAGMFGFERLTAASRQFERAKECGTSETAPLAEALSAAIVATLPEIHSRTVTTVDG
jgi:CheY-like chemotaxis protein